MQLPVNFFRERSADTIHLLQFVNARRKYALEATEPLQKALTALGADASNFL